jgi:hypothetical protein
MRKVVEGTKHAFYVQKIVAENHAVCENVEKYGRARQTTDDNVMLRRKDAICMPRDYSKITDTPSE